MIVRMTKQLLKNHFLNNATNSLYFEFYLQLKVK